MELNEYYKQMHLNKHSQKLIKTLIETVESLREIKKRPLKIMDSGCGSGMFTNILLEKFDNNIISEMHGVDVEKWVSKKVLDDKRFKFYTPDEILKKEKDFDFIFSLDVIEHVEDDMKYLKEFSDLIAKDGVVFIFTPNTYRFNKLIAHNLFKQDYTYPKVVSVDYVNGVEVEQIHVREYSYLEMDEVVKRFFPYMFQLPLFVGLKVPFIGFIGSCNLRFNNFMFNFVDHLLFICSKDSETISLLKKQLT